MRLACTVKELWGLKDNVVTILIFLRSRDVIGHVSIWLGICGFTLVLYHCCKGDQPFQCKTPKFDPSYFPKPLIFPHGNLHRWLCPAYLPMCKIWWKSVSGGFPTNGWNITLAWLFVPFLSFPFFLPSSTGKTIKPILTQGSAFWGLQNLSPTF